MPKDPQGRKWLLTINNPGSKNLDHAAIKEQLSFFQSLTYYCMADEKGKTEHTHLFVVFSSPGALFHHQGPFSGGTH